MPRINDTSIRKLANILTADIFAAYDKDYKKFSTEVKNLYLSGVPAVVKEVFKKYPDFIQTSSYISLKYRDRVKGRNESLHIHLDDSDLDLVPGSYPMIGINKHNSLFKGYKKLQQFNQDNQRTWNETMNLLSRLRTSKAIIEVFPQLKEEIEKMYKSKTAIPAAKSNNSINEDVAKLKAKLSVKKS